MTDKGGKEGPIRRDALIGVDPADLDEVEPTVQAGPLPYPDLPGGGGGSGPAKDVEIDGPVESEPSDPGYVGGPAKPGHTGTPDFVMWSNDVKIEGSGMSVTGSMGMAQHAGEPGDGGSRDDEPAGSDPEPGPEEEPPADPPTEQSLISDDAGGFDPADPVGDVIGGADLDGGRSFVIDPDPGHDLLVDPGDDAGEADLDI